jgi:hypothetical protein
MNDVVTRYAETAFVLLVTGAAMVWAPLALLVGGLYLVVLAVVNDRRSA